MTFDGTTFFSRPACSHLVFLLMLLSACAVRPSTENQAASTAVRAGRQSLDEAFKRHDLPAYVQLTSERVSISGPAWRTVGREQLQDSLSRLASKRTDLQWTHTTTEVHAFAQWEVVYESGEWHETWSVPDGPTELSGKYTGLWRLNEGKWVLDAEVFVPLTCTGRTYCE